MCYLTPIRAVEHQRHGVKLEVQLESALEPAVFLSLHNSCCHDCVTCDDMKALLDSMNRTDSDDQTDEELC